MTTLTVFFLRQRNYLLLIDKFLIEIIDNSIIKRKIWEASSICYKKQTQDESIITKSHTQDESVITKSHTQDESIITNNQTQDANSILHSILPMKSFF